MSDTIQTPQPSTSGEENSRRRFFRRAAIATVVAGLASGIGLKVFAQGGGHGGWYRGGFMGAPLDPATLDEHLDRMLKHLYVEIDATDAQKQQLAPIVKGAARELLPLRAKMHDARRQAVELLSGESIEPRARRSSPSATMGRAFRTRSARVCSGRSTGSRAVGGAQGRDWGWPWCARSRADTAATRATWDASSPGAASS